MKNTRFIIVIALVLLLAGGVGPAQAQGPAGGPNAPAGSAFTYQGQLNKGGSPVNDSCNIQFQLYDALSGGTQVGPTLTRNGVQVAEGLFTVPDLDFGAVFTGDARWLEIAVQCTGDVDFTLLAPRQELTPLPYAMSVPWGGVSAMPAGFADGVDNEGLYTAGIGLSLVGTEFAVTVPYQLPQSCNNGEIPEWNAGASAWQCGIDDIGSGGGGGDITAVYAGTGLTGGGDTGSVTLYADPTYLQRRVGGTCDAGNAIRVINEDGTVTCEPAGAGSHDHWGQTWTGSGTGLTLSGGTAGLSGSGTANGLIGLATTTAGYNAGVLGQTASSVGGMGVHGIAAAASGTTYGVGGVSSSTDGRGVYGAATATGGTTYGVYGTVDSTDGRGVYGQAPRYGVYGQTTATSGGYGVYGYATATTGASRGVYGRAASTDGRGVFGYATATSGTTYGVYGESSSTSGIGVNGIGYVGVSGEATGTGGSGVYGYSSSTTGMTRGVYGQAASTDGRGVFGYVTATSGTTYGVYGEALSSQGVGVLGTAAAAGVRGDTDSVYGAGVMGFATATAGQTYGVIGSSDSSGGFGVAGFSPYIGVYARSESTTGTARGVYAESRSPDSSAVYGENLASSGNAYGVYGESYSAAGRGVYGLAPLYGVLGVAEATTGYNVGVRGESNSTGGWGVAGIANTSTGANYGVGGVTASPSGYAVYGSNTASTGNAYAVYGVNSSTAGRAVYGLASAASGTTYGIYGRSDSPYGTGVYGYASATGSGTPFGVLGKSDSTDGAGIGGEGGIGVKGYTTLTTGWAGYFSTILGNGVYVSAPSGKTGLIVAGGSKNAVVRTAEGSRLLYTEESTEVWFTDYGFGRTLDGRVKIAIDPLFAQTVNLVEPYMVFVSPEGDCGLYVAEKTTTSFTVRALDGKTCSVAFDYRIVARRLGFEGDRLEPAPWADDDPNLYPEKRAEWEARYLRGGE